MPDLNPKEHEYELLDNQAQQELKELAKWVIEILASGVWIHSNYCAASHMMLLLQMQRVHQLMFDRMTLRAEGADSDEE